jgi:hypothetical protein
MQSSFEPQAISPSHDMRYFNKPICVNDVKSPRGYAAWRHDRGACPLGIRFRHPDWLEIIFDVTAFTPRSADEKPPVSANRGLPIEGGCLDTD